MSAQTPPCRPRKLTRTVWWAAGLAVITAIVYLMATASTGPVDPTEATAPQSHATVVFNSAIIVRTSLGKHGHSASRRER